MLTHFITGVLGAGLAAVLLLAFYNGSSGSGSSGSGASGSGMVPAPAASAAPLGKSAKGVAARVRPGVVIIDTTLRYDSERAAGSGMVINSDGLVLTNNHVIEDSTSVTATVPATGRTYQATVLGYDKTGDIALIRLQDASGLATVPIGNSSSVKAGAAVVALGNAGGQNSITAAAGQVTALNQTITASDEAGSTNSETLHGMIQVNADIVAGDSGGPLSGPGGVVGMDTAGNDAGYQQQAVGFAIPVNTALAVARQIAAGQASSVVAIGYPPFLGIFVGTGSDSSPQDQAQQAQQSGSGGSQGCSASNAGLIAPSSIAPVSSGVLVDGTICGSPAAQAGLTGGSVITAINGQSVGSPDHLGVVLAQFRPGDMISVTWVSPAGQRTTSSIRLTAGPPQ